MRRCACVLLLALTACAATAPSRSATDRVPPAPSLLAAQPSATAAPATAMAQPIRSAVASAPTIATATPSATPTAISAPADVQHAQHYYVHLAHEGETLADLDVIDPQTVLAYNHQINATLRPQQPLVIGSDQARPDDWALVERGNPDQPRVALTFDAGASAIPTPHILDALRERHVHVTFFLTGTWMRENPELLRQIVADGHELANHSLTHRDFRKLDAATIVQELEDTDAIAHDTAGVDTRPYFRPPYGAYDKRVLQTVIDRGWLPVYWTLDSLDSIKPERTPEFLINRVTTKLQGKKLNGAIILMHCGSTATAAAVPVILDRFAALGVRVTTVSEVLGP